MYAFAKSEVKVHETITKIPYDPKLVWDGWENKTRGEKFSVKIQKNLLENM